MLLVTVSDNSAVAGYILHSCELLDRSLNTTRESRSNERSHNRSLSTQNAQGRHEAVRYTSDGVLLVRQFAGSWYYHRGSGTSGTRHPLEGSTSPIGTAADEHPTDMSISHCMVASLDPSRPGGPVEDYRHQFVLVGYRPK